MTEAKQTWTDLGDQLNELGLKLRLHLEQAAKDGDVEGEDRVRKALHTLTDAVEQAFGALGTAARDDAVREDVKDAGKAFVDALDATFAEVTARLRDIR